MSCTVRRIHLLFAVSVCLSVMSIQAQVCIADETTTFGGITFAYSHSENNLPVGQRSYTLQPSINGRLGVMQADVGVRYKGRGFQATLAAQQGWFADANYTGDDYAYRYLQQAWLAADLMSNVSLRAGIMPSHIGYESINERENLVLSRLFCSDATPYYETGAALQWRPTDALTVEGLVLNGWQRIVAINDDLAWGTRIVWKPDSTLTINWSTFVGNMVDQRSSSIPELSRTNPQQRMYSNLWTEWSPTTNVTVVGIADVGQQGLDTAISASSSASMWCVSAIVAYRFEPRWRIALRGEHYSDPSSMIVRPVDGTGFKASSISVNLDCTARPNLLLRAEFRSLFSDRMIFPARSGLSTSDMIATVSASYVFHHVSSRQVKPPD